jgi:beta-xylosidase
VLNGNGAWAPSIRFFNGVYYCLIPLPDDGVYVSTTRDPFGTWSPLRKLIDGSGIIDPCPIWADGKAYIVTAFAKSRVGFNSMLAVYEADESLTKLIYPDYKIVYDGHNDNPTIEGPKFYRIGEYFYILAPAGGVKTGWQTALRAKNVYGPYESKIILMQHNSDVNGPHQGALVDLKDGGWAFVHFQDFGAVGRIVHLQPVTWKQNWPLCGAVDDTPVAGTPVKEDEYPVDIKTDYCLQKSDDFSGDKLSLMWQMSANFNEKYFTLNGGLNAICKYCNLPLNEVPQMISCRIYGTQFFATVQFKKLFACDGDEAGFGIFGDNYIFIRAIKRALDTRVEIVKMNDGKVSTMTVLDSCNRQLTLGISGKINVQKDLDCDIYLGQDVVYRHFTARSGKWVGARLGMYALNSKSQTSGGKAIFTNFNYKEV